MDIKQVLEDFATNLKVDGATVFPSVFYGNDFETNARAADDATYPMCQIVPPLASGIDLNPKTGSQKDRFSVFIFFCDKHKSGEADSTDIDSTAVQNDIVIKRMRAAVKQYVADINNSGQYEQITKVDLKHVFFKFDAVVAGLLAFFTLKELEPTKYC